MERRPVLVVLDAPEPLDDVRRALLCGPGGDLVRGLLDRLDLSGQVQCTTLLRCASLGRPDQAAVKACEGFLRAELDRVRPQVIIAAGGATAAWFSGIAIDAVKTLRRGSLTQYHGNGWTADVVLTIAPATVADLRGPQRVASEGALLIDFSTARSLRSETAAAKCETARRTREPWGVRPYVHGWHVGERVFLVGRGPEGRYTDEVERGTAPHYFLVPRRDVTPTVKPKFDALCRLGFAFGKRTIAIRGVRPDPQAPDEWLRVYADVPDNWVSRWCRGGLDEWDARRYQSRSPYVRSIVRAFEVIGVRSYEADVDPLRRFLTDRAVLLGTPRRCWLDIETDDSKLGREGDAIGSTPILSWAIADQDGLVASQAMERWTEDSERTVLRDLAECLASYDMVVAWFGRAFDFPFIFERWRRFGIDGAAYALAWQDAADVFMRHRQHSGGSMSLGAVGMDVCSRGKVDRPSGSMRDLWRFDRPSLLRYNEGDALLLRDIDLGYGGGELELQISRAANCFPAHDLISERVEGLALQLGYMDGTHFPTVESEQEDQVGFEGGLVIEPLRGLHPDVVTLDFAGLYPSIMASYNISPDTYLDPREAENTPSARVVTTVSGARFRRDVVGVLAGVIGLTTAQRSAAVERAAVAASETAALQEQQVARAWKVLGVSIYGAMGNPHSRYYRREVAAAVTATGRAHLAEAVKTAERCGLPVLYGDTDSLFIRTLEGAPAIDDFQRAAMRAFEKMADAANAPQRRVLLRVERHYRLLLLIDKKTYAGLVLGAEGDDEPEKIVVRGLESRRGDVCALVRHAQDELLDLVLRGRATLEAVVSWLRGWRTRVLCGHVARDEVVESVGLGDLPEKYLTKPPHVRVAEQLRAAGRPIWVGMKVAYVIVDGDVSPLVVESDTGKTPPDYAYYWNKKVLPALLRVLSTVWPDHPWGSYGISRTDRSGGTGDLFAG